MEKRIELERRGQPPGSVLELNLDNCRSTSIVGLTEEFSNLRSLSLINVGLISLRGFPKLPQLIKIELSDNRISGGLHCLHGSPKLVHINLGGNRISDFEALEPLKEFKHLKCLDLFANTIECYKEKVFNLLPSLIYLDGLDRNEKEMNTDDEEVNGVEFDSDEDSDNYLKYGPKRDEDDSESDCSTASSSMYDDVSDGDSLNKYDDYDLGKVYDPGLKDESDNEDYDGEGVEEEDDEDFDDCEYEYPNDEESEEEEAAAPAAAPASEEDATPRGKKRKHDDAEEGQDV